MGLLSSALSRPRNSFAYSDPKPSLAEIAASYAFGLAKNHPFVDGNKRIALTAAAVFLEINGHALVAPEAEAVVMFRGLAAGEVNEAELAGWISSNLKPLSRDG